MTERLIQGYQRFRNGFFRRNRDRLTILAEKQSPLVAMITCCDSQVDPAILFDAEPTGKEVMAREGLVDTNARATACEQTSVRHSLHNGELTLHGVHPPIG